MVNKGRRSQQFVINSGNNKIMVTALTLGPIGYNEGCNNLREEMPGIVVTLRSQQIMGEITAVSDTGRMRGIAPAFDQRDCVSLRAGVAI